MRQYAMLQTPVLLNNYGDLCRRIIIDKQKEQIVYMYLCTEKEDKGCQFDYYFTSLEDAYSVGEDYGVSRDEWIDLPKLPDGCIRSYMRPVRFNKGLNYLEEYLDDEWKKIEE